MSGITISITIPRQLEQHLSSSASSLGISRSRCIGNILLQHQQKDKKEKKINTCLRKDHDSFCSVYGHTCVAIQTDAEDCPDFQE
ncbi:unnamed protein product [marine sediment metagenome]|uniref:Uncharacterized protein n=1 Tax=marine sediment metagenome TaxID=412755 RepID=X0YTV8_9ZZZZ